MTFRPSPKYASKDAKQGPWSTCDRCGFIWSQRSLRWQYDYRGGATPFNLRTLHCPRCYDDLDFQRKLLILPPDPPPILNTRPEVYSVDETDFMADQLGNIIDTESGSDIIVSNSPEIAGTNTDPDWLGNTVPLVATVNGNNQSIANMFLDLFDGNPLVDGASVLQKITGSATRTNVSSQLSNFVNAQGSIWTNPTVILITSSCLAITNVCFVGFFSAATGGSQLMFGPVHTRGPSASGINKGMIIQFNILDLTITNAHS